MKNSRGFLIIPLLLFSIFFNPGKVLASVSSQATINYSLTNTFNTTLDVVLKNSSRNVAVVNYFTILLPYQNVSNIKLTMAGRSVSSTAYKQKNGTEVIINLKNLVIQGRSSDAFKISFQSLNTVDSNWGYAKLKSNIDGLKVDKVTFKYDNAKPQISFVNGATLTKVEDSHYEFTKINSPTLTINFGSPVTFKYSFNKTYLNDSQETTVQEVVLPTTDNTQVFILAEMTPKPVSQRLDNESNVILGFNVEPGKQTVVNILGYILKRIPRESDLTYEDTDLATEGFWNLSNQFERIRLQNYLKENKYEKTAPNISKFVASRLMIDKTASEGTNSFESALRLGPDTAIGRKESAIAEDYVDLLIALLRDNSIPSRMVVGYFPKSHQFISDGAFHSWVEYYDLKDKVWRNLDPSTADLFKSPNYDADNVNTIKLLVRSKHYNLPKLPFVTNKDLVISPSSEISTEVFDVDLDKNILANNGNTVVKISTSEGDTVVLPKESTEIKTPGKITVSTLYGESKEFNINASQVVNGDQKNNILSEIILLTIFLLVASICVSIYAKIKNVR